MVNGREQVPADVFTVPGVAPGDRRAYALPAEPVPACTIEVLSTSIMSRRDRAEFEAKRSRFGRIGVPLHLEVDPDEGFIAVWELRDGLLVRTDLRHHLHVRRHRRPASTRPLPECSTSSSPTGTTCATSATRGPCRARGGLRRAGGRPGGSGGRPSRPALGQAPELGINEP